MDIDNGFINAKDFYENKIKELKAQLEKAESIIKKQLDFEAKSISKHGEYVGEEINELIKKAREYFER